MLNIFICKLRLTCIPVNKNKRIQKTNYNIISDIQFILSENQSLIFSDCNYWNINNVKALKL